VVPPWPVRQVLIFMAKLLPKEKLVPQKDLAELAFKEKQKQEQVSVCHGEVFETNIGPFHSIVVFPSFLPF
jgi:hypothetical protein